MYVSGGVNQAGLYALPPASRVNDAIQAAGGFSQNADKDQLNLAGLLEDGEQINVPDLLPTSAPDAQTKTVNSELTLVNINTATLEQLDTLPEIGLKTAQAIIDYRNTNGPFASIEDILDVSGIGQVTFDKIKDLITAGTYP